MVPAAEFPDGARVKSLHAIQHRRDNFFPPSRSYCCGPNYDDALYYFYSNELHFPPEMMGRISLSHSVARCVGIGIYNMFLQAVPARRLVIGATLLSLPLYITPVLITSGLYVKWGLSARWLALGGEMVRDAFL